MTENSSGNNKGDETQNIDSPELRKISNDELQGILDKHEIWVESGCKGEGKADLRATDLQETCFNDRVLQDAIFLKANLQKAKFVGTNLHKANLFDAELQDAVFYMASLQDADLERAKLNQAELLCANLKGANLKNADLTMARNLLAKQLAGLNLTGAKLPDDIHNFEGPLSVVEEASKNARNLFFAMLTACVYTLLTVATTTDKALILNDTSSTLPVINTAFPIVYFYWASPILLLALYAYFHLYLLRMFENIADLPAIFPDGRPLHKKVYPWLLSGLVNAHVAILKADRPVLSRLQVFVSVALGWGFVPFTLLFILGRYLPKHDWMGMSYHGITTSISIVLAYLFYQIASETLNGNDARKMFKPIAGLILPVFYKRIVGFAVMVLLLIVYIYNIGGLPDAGANWLVNANIAGEALSVKPDNWTGKDPTQLHLVKGAMLDGVHLEYANAYESFLVNATLLAAHLEGINLRYAQLKEADLSDAHLEDANLRYVDFRGADLSGVHLERAHMRCAHLMGTNLRSANLEGADLYGVRFGIYSTSDHKKPTDIRYANLSGVTGLTQAQLENAWGNHSTVLPRGYDYPADWK